MGLRLREGVPLVRLQALGMEDIAAHLAGLEEMGLVAADGGQLRVTEAGRPVLNAVLRTILGA
jgi:oxygen-independent coproporphyrinogen-3 oxidase